MTSRDVVTKQTDYKSESESATMPRNNATRSKIDRLLDFLLCRRNKTESEINDDDLVITRVFKSSSVVELRGNQGILPGFPYIPPKLSRSDIFNPDKAKSQVQEDKNQTRKSRFDRGNRNAERNRVMFESGARNDLGGDTGDVVFDESDGLEIINLL